MAEDTKVVETKTEIATTPHEVDYEAVLKEKDAELAKVRDERENYRKGMLKAKGKLPEDNQPDTDNPEGWREEARQIARETVLETKEAQLQAEKDATIVALAKRTKELELALKNRGQINAPSASGSNQDKPEVKTDTFFSQDQINALKAKGWDDKKIEAAKQNMIKASQAPKL